MDELLIEEKKYLSSKRAAKVTGYAKDYIGQLCREGRVPARLVGRSWYVLESAIRDHRFGEQKGAEQQEEKTPAEDASPAWESPRYEASPAEVLPTLNRLRQEAHESTGNDMAQNLQDSWKAWFDRVAEAAPSISDVVPEKAREEDEERDEPEQEVSVPIRTIHRQLPEELMPRHNLVKDIQEEEEEPPVQETERRGRRKGTMLTIQLAGALFAIIVAGLAFLGSGYFDTYVLSHPVAGFTAGVDLYNR